MGNDPKNTSDVAKAVPGAAHSMLATTAGQIADESETAEGPAAAPASGTFGQSKLDLSAPIDYCERVHVLRFETLDGATPRLHQQIQLVIANPPHVADMQGERIAVLCDPQDRAIFWCLVGLYVITGEIVALEPDGESGDVRVSGRLGAELE